MEEDLILGEEEKPTVYDIIESQLMVINELSTLDDPDLVIDKALIIQNAFKIIHKAQKTLLKELR